MTPFEAITYWALDFGILNGYRRRTKCLAVVPQSFKISRIIKRAPDKEAIFCKTYNYLYGHRIPQQNTNIRYPIIRFLGITSAYIGNAIIPSDANTMMTAVIKKFKTAMGSKTFQPNPSIDRSVDAVTMRVPKS